MVPNKSDSRTKHKWLLARFYIVWVHLGASNLIIEVYNTPPHENLQTIMRHTVCTCIIWSVLIKNISYSWVRLQNITEHVAGSSTPYQWNSRPSPSSVATFGIWLNQKEGLRPIFWYNHSFWPKFSVTYWVEHSIAEYISGPKRLLVVLVQTATCGR